MNNIDETCALCGAQTKNLVAVEMESVPCNVREFSSQSFHVWRCRQCWSLHCLEPIDYDRYYENYPIRRQKNDFFTKITLRRRLSFLTRTGLKAGGTLLDYGCGSGHFVRYAREKGIQAYGFDPYSSEFNDVDVLSKKYDFVVAQDVVEHVDDPNALICKLKTYVRSGGVIAIGTPNADGIDLRHPLDKIGPLHQPYHRHIYSRSMLEKAVSDDGWSIIESSADWYVNTVFPFVNSAFLFRYFRSGGGFMDIGFEPVSPFHMLRNPTLFFWGLLGAMFCRETDMLVIARSHSR